MPNEMVLLGESDAPSMGFEPMTLLVTSCAILLKLVDSVDSFNKFCLLSTITANYNKQIAESSLLVPNLSSTEV
eukprot:scaffold72706_cov37-Cyclotella_meneghiniana.AAC.1